jgi:hypothetical protein
VHTTQAMLTVNYLAPVASRQPPSADWTTRTTTGNIYFSLSQTVDKHSCHRPMICTKSSILKANSVGNFKRRQLLTLEQSLAEAHFQWRLTPQTISFCFRTPPLGQA